MTAIDWLVLVVAVVVLIMLASQYSYTVGRSYEMLRVKDLIIKRYSKFTKDYETERNTISKDGVTFLKPVPKVIGIVAKEVFEKVLEELDEEEKTIGSH
jgi:hypothetical protein